MDPLADVVPNLRPERRIAGRRTEDFQHLIAIGFARFDLGELESLCPTTPLGTKAVGEGGAITSLPAIANAVEDALTPFGVKVTSLPITPEKVLRAIRGARMI